MHQITLLLADNVLPPMTLRSGFAWGILGGGFAELAAWFKLRQLIRSERPAYLNDWFYWTITVLMIVAGGGLVVAYLASDMGQIKPIMAVNIGATAPLIIATLTTTVPKPPVRTD